VSQPLDRTCTLEPLGDIDHAAGEFWAQPFEMAKTGHNLSAYESNRLFLNAGGEFIDASFASNADIDSDSRAAMIGDFNGDGAPDLLVGSVGGGSLRLFHNRLVEGRHRVELRLVGTDSNRSGIGARIEAWCGEKRMMREVFPANGFMGQSPARLSLGTGTAERIDRLVIRWPSGLRQELTDVPVDRIVTITEGVAEPGLESFPHSAPREP
jgi:enediyne biosynthesis protein E4